MASRMGSVAERLQRDAVTRGARGDDDSGGLDGVLRNGVGAHRNEDLQRLRCTDECRSRPVHEPGLEKAGAGTDRKGYRCDSGMTHVALGLRIGQAVAP